MLFFKWDIECLKGETKGIIIDFPRKAKVNM